MAKKCPQANGQPCPWKCAIVAQYYTVGKCFYPHSRKFTLPSAHFVTTTLECLEMNMGRLVQKTWERSYSSSSFLSSSDVSCILTWESAERRGEREAVLHYLDRQSLRNSTVFRRSSAYQVKISVRAWLLCSTPCNEISRCSYHLLLVLSSTALFLGGIVGVEMDGCSAVE